MFNSRWPRSCEETTLPDRLLKEPIPDGPSKGMLSRLPEMLPSTIKPADGMIRALPPMRNSRNWD
jgi:aldehyde:ferredoxin oxidoreductase